MSCDECEKFQESEQTSFYRWKNANIEMRGCKKHLIEIFEALNQKQKACQPEENEDLTWRANIPK